MSHSVLSTTFSAVCSSTSWIRRTERHISGLPVLQSVCKNETSTRPCPRLVLVCCTALVTRGLETEGLFLEEAPQDLVQSMLGTFQEGPVLLYAMLR